MAERRGRASAAAPARPATATSRERPRGRVPRRGEQAPRRRPGRTLAATRLFSTPNRAMAGITAKAPSAEPARSKKYTRRAGRSGSESSAPSTRPQNANGTAKSSESGHPAQELQGTSAPVSAGGTAAPRPRGRRRRWSTSAVSAASAAQAESASANRFSNTREPAREHDAGEGEAQHGQGDDQEGEVVEQLGRDDAVDEDLQEERVGGGQEGDGPGPSGSAQDRCLRLRPPPSSGAILAALRG